MRPFHLLSHNVGVVKPFETGAVIKGYANKLDLEGVDAFKAPSVYTVHCISSYLCKSCQCCVEVSIYLPRNKNILAYMYSLLSGLCF